MEGKSNCIEKGEIANLDNLPFRIQRDLEHVQQSSNWDCGLACIRMVLSYPKEDELMINEFKKACDDSTFGRSTWTIDLCHIFRKLNVSHHYYTITWGINPEHTTVPFYKESLDKDTQRILESFEVAEKSGISIFQRKLSLQEILNHLATKGLVIALTNARLLFCSRCQTLPALSSRMKSLLSKLPYQGHYIVVCGYDLENQIVYYRNPTTKSCLCVMSFEQFDMARSSSGTDDDIILIFPKDA